MSIKIKTSVKYENFQGSLFREDMEDFVKLMHNDQQILFSAYDLEHVIRVLRVLKDVWLIDETRDEDDIDGDY